MTTTEAYEIRTERKEAAYKAISKHWQTCLIEWFGKNDLHVDLDDRIPGKVIGTISFGCRKNPMYLKDQYESKLDGLKASLRENGFKGLKIRKHNVKPSFDGREFVEITAIEFKVA